MGFPFHHFFLFFSSSTFFIFKVEVVQLPGVRKKISSGITKRVFFFFFFFSFLVLPQGVCTCTYIIDYFCVFLGRLYIIFASGEKDMIFYWTNH